MSVSVHRTEYPCQVTSRVSYGLGVDSVRAGSKLPCTSWQGALHHAFEANPHRRHHSGCDKRHKSVTRVINHAQSETRALFGLTQDASWLTWSISSFTISILRHIMALNCGPPHAAKSRSFDGSSIAAPGQRWPLCIAGCE